MRRFLIIMAFGFVNFTILNSFSNDSNLLIIGSWISNEDVDSKLVFDSSGKCYEKYSGETIDVYRYSIIKEANSSGKTFETLKLINISDSDDIYLYDLNSLTNEVLVLQYLDNNKLFSYARE